MSECNDERITNEDIENICERSMRAFISRKHGGVADQVDICLFARDFLGLKVVMVNFAENTDGAIVREGFLGDGISQVAILENGKPIYKMYPQGTMLLEQLLLDTGREEDLRRLRFSAAHECGHWILANYIHHHSVKPRTPSMSSMDTQMILQEIREDEANRAAACLLMPRFLVERHLYNLSENRKVVTYGNVLAPEFRPIVNDLVDKLNVNYMPLRYRLGELDLYDSRPEDEIVDILLEEMKWRVNNS